MKQSKTMNRLADGSTNPYQNPSSTPCTTSEQVKRMPIRFLILALVCIIVTCLSACKTTDTKTEYVSVYKTEYVYPSDALLTPCPEQEALSFDTNGEMLMSLIELTTKYAICSARMTAVIQYVDSVKATNGIRLNTDESTGVTDEQIPDNQSSDEQNLKVE